MDQQSEKKVIIGIILASLVLLIGGAFFLSRPSSSTSQIAVTDNEKKFLVKESSHQTYKGAKVEVVEFADLQCPACGESSPIIERIKEKYKEQMNFVYRHYPLSMHKNALGAAIVAETAANQNKFWEMQKKLFDAQDSWSNIDNPSSVWEGYAKELGLDMEKYKNDLNDKTLEDKIRADYSDGVSLGVDSTPTFFINGVKYVGGINEEEFIKIIDSLL